MSSREFSGWLAYFQVDPPPDPHLSAGIIAHTVASANWSGKGRRPKLDDYIPKARYATEAIDADDAAERIIKQLGAVPKG